MGATSLHGSLRDESQSVRPPRRMAVSVVNRQSIRTSCQLTVAADTRGILDIPHLVVYHNRAVREQIAHYCVDEDE